MRRPIRLSSPDGGPARAYRLDRAPAPRFYAARSILMTTPRILTGQPAMPIGHAIRALGSGNA